MTAANAPTRQEPEPRGRVDARRVASSIDALFGAEVRGEPLAHDDGKTGARLERVVVDGQSYVLKHLHPADDWGMRATGDTHCRPITLWRHGWLDELPTCLDHAIVGAAWDERPDGRSAVLVMRDVGDRLVPAGNDVLPLTQHRAFLDHMAQLHAAFWGRDDTIGLLPLSTRYVFFGPRLAETERAGGGTHPVPTQLVPDIADRTGDPGAFAHAATAAGLTNVRIDVIEVDAGLDDAERAVAWRLNMPHTIGFVADLDAATRTALHARARAALPATLPPALPMLALRAHVDGDSNGWSE